MSIFNKIQITTPKSSTFDLSFDHKTTLKMTNLTPFLVQDVLPGDKFDITTSSMIRFAPLVSPVMHNVNVFKHFFFVPYRVLWEGWNDFISGNYEGATVPNIKGTDVDPFVIAQGDLADHLGLPLTTNMKEPISILHFLAYHKIFHDYFRDQNNDTSPEWKVLAKSTTGSIAPSLFAPDFFKLRQRAWQHDYFTSCLPFAQKGDPVSIPMSLDGTVRVDRARNLADDKINAGDISNKGIGFGSILQSGLAGINQDIYLEGDLSDADVTNSGTINDLRRAMALQRFLEKSARAGTRINEFLRSMFGVKPDDLRLDRSLYLGGSKDPVVISEVLQTSATETNEDGTAQGNMAGHSVSYGRGNGCNYYVPEHGVIIGLVSVMPTTSYAQGINRQFSKLDRFDFALPDFAHIGEQEVLGKEIYYNGYEVENNSTFGYLPRYMEYRYNPSLTTGEFRTTQQHWTLTRFFENRPNLNQAFIYASEAEMRRIFAYYDPEDPDNTPDYVYAHIHCSIQASRRLPKYGTPLGL